MLNRSKLLALALLVAAFAAGIAVGAGAHAAADSRREPRQSYVDRLATDLALTPAQRDTVELILEAYGTAMREMWNEVRPRIEAMRLDIRGRITTLLTSEQRARYAALNQRRDSIRAAREAGHDQK